MRRRSWLLLILTGGLLAAFASDLSAQDVRQVEVVQVEGLIDSSVERTVRSVIEDAERAEAAMVVLQIDSAGVVGPARAERLRRLIRSSAVPVVTWVGPAQARAAHGALVVMTAGIPTAAPGAIIGPLESIDFRERLDLDRLPDSVRRLPRDVFEGPLRITSRGDFTPLTVVAPSIEELLTEVQTAAAGRVGRPIPTFDTDDARIRFHNLDLFGRLLHAAAKPSITYLLVLAGLVGIVFELFHPSTGPAGISGVAALALGLFGIVTLGGSWLGLALIVAGVAGFAVDLRYQGLGPFTVAGFAALVAGSLLLFRGPWLHVSPWLLAFGITSMVLFLVGAMTRVLRDLRAVARGELEVRDAHPNGHGG
jgi:membrane-bound serine protease (ClpP class)